MQDSGAGTQQRDGVGFVLVVALFVLTPPLVEWWASADGPWHLPYLIWASILGASVVFRRIGRHDL
jgi:hypothetical protein